MMTCVKDFMSQVVCQWWHIMTTLLMILCLNYFVNDNISRLLCQYVATTLSMMTCCDYGGLSMMTCVHDNMLRLLCQWWHVTTTLSRITDRLNGQVGRAFTLSAECQGWLAQCQFKLTEWNIMFICGMVPRCAVTLKAGLNRVLLQQMWQSLSYIAINCW